VELDLALWPADPVGDHDLRVSPLGLLDGRVRWPRDTRAARCQRVRDRRRVAEEQPADEAETVRVDRSVTRRSR
jgi:hypothetical protein